MIIVRTCFPALPHLGVAGASLAGVDGERRCSDTLSLAVRGGVCRCKLMDGERCCTRVRRCVCRCVSVATR